MNYLALCIVYGFMLYGLIELLVYFPGPFNILGKFRTFMHWLHPQLGELISCPMCSSTWIGGGISAFNYFLISTPFTPFNIFLAGTGLWWLIIPFDTFFGCGVVWLLHVIDDYFESNTNTEYEDE